MGLFAFDERPEHCEIYRKILQSPLPRLYGVEEKWDMPVVRHRAVLRSGIQFLGVPHYVLTYHIGGPAVRRVNFEGDDDKGGEMVARTGAISLQIPDSAGQYESEGNGKVDYAHFYFDTSLVESVAEELSDAVIPEGDFFGRIDTCWQRDLVAYLDRASNSSDRATMEEMDQRARVVIMGLLRQPKEVVAPRPGETALSNRQVEGLRQFVLARLSESIRVPELAQFVGLSVFHFTRRFKSATGETPSSFIVRLRLEEAVRMLRETDAPISKIAFETGFSSQSHLAKHIKRTYSLTPTQLRQNSLL